MAQVLLTTADAAKILGISTARVRQLDSALDPIRLSDGQRVYEKAKVEALAEARSVKAVAR